MSLETGKYFTTEAEDRAFESYQEQQMEIENRAAEEACAVLKAQGIECDVCRIVLCTNQADCRCATCLGIPF